MVAQHTYPFWLRIMPGILRDRLGKNVDLRKMLNNTGWLIGDRLVRIIVGLGVGVWMARYLGPQRFGLLSFAMAFVSLFGAIASFGLQEIVVRDIVREPSFRDVTLGSALFIRTLGGLGVFLLASVSILFIRPNESTTKIMVALLGFIMVFKATEVVKYWFESQLQAKFNVLIEGTAFLAFGLVKVVLILTKAPLLAFVWAIFGESFVVSLGFLFVYIKVEGKLRAWKLRLGRVKGLVLDSWPLLLSGLAITFYMSIDQVMLGKMVGDGGVGVYSAAVRVSEVWYFLPVAVTASVFPALIRAKQKSPTIYDRRLQHLFDSMVLISVGIALPMTFLSNWIIVTFFGAAFKDAGPVLSIHIWASVFVFLGVASSKWFIIENLQKLTLTRTIWGGVANVAINLVLIPKYGALGAAWATLISQAIASVFFNASNKETRELFKKQMRSFLVPSLWNVLLKKTNP